MRFRRRYATVQICCSSESAGSARSSSAAITPPAPVTAHDDVSRRVRPSAAGGLLLWRIAAAALPLTRIRWRASAISIRRRVDTSSAWETGDLVTGTGQHDVRDDAGQTRPQTS